MDNTYGQLTFWKQFLQSQLENNLEYMVKHSIKDFHTKGFNYLCFLFSPELTIRLYIIEPSEPMDTTKINIHNHLYDSQILVLLGRITNIVYSETDNKNLRLYNAYHLTSALHPENKERIIKLKKLEQVRLKVENILHLREGMTHFQPHNEIHSVTNNPLVKTVFMIWEYKTQKEHSTLYTTREFGNTLATPNAYNKFTAEEITKLLTDLIKEI